MRMSNGFGGVVKLGGNRRKPFAARITSGWEDGKHKFHDTRKSCISFLHEKEVPIETIRVIVGHAQQGVTEQRYLKKSIDSLVEAINKLD